MATSTAFAFPPDRSVGRRRRRDSDDGKSNGEAASSRSLESAAHASATTTRSVVLAQNVAAVVAAPSAQSVERAPVASGRRQFYSAKTGASRDRALAAAATNLSTTATPPSFPPPSPPFPELDPLSASVEAPPTTAEPSRPLVPLESLFPSQSELVDTLLFEALSPNDGPTSLPVAVAPAFPPSLSEHTDGDRRRRNADLESIATFFSAPISAAAAAAVASKSAVADSRPTAGTSRPDADMQPLLEFFAKPAVTSAVVVRPPSSSSSNREKKKKKRGAHTVAKTRVPKKERDVPAIEPAVAVVARPRPRQPDACAYSECASHDEKKATAAAAVSARKAIEHAPVVATTVSLPTDVALCPPPAAPRPALAVVCAVCNDERYCSRRCCDAARSEHRKRCAVSVATYRGDPASFRVRRFLERVSAALTDARCEIDWRLLQRVQERHGCVTEVVCRRDLCFRGALGDGGGDEKRGGSGNGSTDGGPSAGRSKHGGAQKTTGPVPVVAESNDKRLKDYIVAAVNHAWHRVHHRMTREAPSSTTPTETTPLATDAALTTAETDAVCEFRFVVDGEGDATSVEKKLIGKCTRLTLVCCDGDTRHSCEARTTVFL